MKNTPPVILTCATTDSGGGAGIQADLKTITCLGGFGTSVLAALTAQNGATVAGIHALPPEFVALQYRTVLEGFPVKAAKTGMLYSAELIEVMADCLATKNFPLVVDPVSVSQSGCQLLRDDAVESLVKRIIPLADLLTPNRPEAEMLAGMSINSVDHVKKAASRLLSMGAKAVLIKGGHFEENGETMTDWLITPETFIPLAHPRVETTNNHGTGCTLSAAIATFLGFGEPLQTAVHKAQLYLTAALRTSFCPGIGAGAPNFLGGADAVVQGTA